MAKNLTPTTLADIQQASVVGLKDPTARAMLDPMAGRTTGTVNSWQARKKTGVSQAGSAAGDHG